MFSLFRHVLHGRTAGFYEGEDILFATHFVAVFNRR